MNTTPTNLRAADLRQRLEAGEPLQLVDVREAAELALAALPLEVIHLPLSGSADWMERIGTVLDRERDVVVLCHSGIRSWQFGCWLIETQGYERVWNLLGGIDAWSVEVDASVPRY
jgi:rhodanese-related sulfurtransferase